MSWTGIDNFDSYTDGDLNGKNGGSGWSGAWSGTAAFDVQGTTVFQGTKAIVVASELGGDRIARTISSPAATGIVHYAFRYTTSGIMQVSLRTGATQVCIVRESGNDIKLFNNLTQVSVESSTVAAGNWYELYVEYDCTTDKYRAKIGGVPTGSWYDFFNGNTATTVDTVTIEHWQASNSDLWFDDIKSGETASSTIANRVATTGRVAASF